MTSPDFSAAVGETIDKIEAAIRGVAVPLDDIGIKLWAGLALIAFIWQAGKWVLDEGNWSGVLAGMIRTIFLFSLAFLLMQPDTGGGNKVVNFASSLVGDAAQRIAGEGGLKGVVVGATESVSQLVGNINNSITALVQRQEGVFGKIVVVVEMLPSFFILGGAEAALLLAAGILFIVGIAGLVLTQVATIVAPLFIPWMVLPVTSFLFDGWLRFAIGAVLYSLAAPIMLKIAAAVIATVSMPPPSGDPATFGGSVGAATLVFMVAITVAWLAAQVPSIAQGLMSGSASSSLAGAGRGERRPTGRASREGDRPFFPQVTPAPNAAGA